MTPRCVCAYSKRSAKATSGVCSEGRPRPSWSRTSGPTWPSKCAKVSGLAILLQSSCSFAETEFMSSGRRIRASCAGFMQRERERERLFSSLILNIKQMNRCYTHLCTCVSLCPCPSVSWFRCCCLIIIWFPISEGATDVVYVFCGLKRRLPRKFSCCVLS